MCSLGSGCWESTLWIGLLNQGENLVFIVTYRKAFGLNFLGYSSFLRLILHHRVSAMQIFKCRAYYGPENLNHSQCHHWRGRWVRWSHLTGCMEGPSSFGDLIIIYASSVWLSLFSQFSGDQIFQSWKNHYLLTQLCTLFYWSQPVEYLLWSTIEKIEASWRERYHLIWLGSRWPLNLVDEKLYSLFFILCTKFYLYRHLHRFIT